MQVVGITILLILAAIVAVGVVFLSYWPMYGAPFVPTDNKEIEEILNRVKLGKGQVFCDVGCGDGRMVLAAAKITKTVAYGVDVNWGLIMWCRIKAWTDKLARFERINFFKQDLPKADVYYLYLWPGVVEKVAKKIFEQNKKATVITKSFEVKSLKSENKFVVKGARFWVYENAPNSLVPHPQPLS